MRAVRVASIELRGFKRFANLTIVGLPASARLVVLAGPNGFGKSSLFDGLQLWAAVNHGGRSITPYNEYYDRPRGSGFSGSGDQEVWAAGRVKVSFHGAQPATNSDAAKKAIYVRSAYRSVSELVFGGLTRLGSPLDEYYPQRMIDAHPAASANYMRLVSDGFDDVYEDEERSTTLGDFCDRSIGDLRDAMQRLFPGLLLNGLSSPMRDPTMRFSKGETRGFTYTNLSGGERAALDLLLDVKVKRRDYDATVYCIDEPELHLNPRVHGAILSELLGMIPPRCQLWVATHAVGMLRRARDMEAEEPGSVVFLDFGGHDFDIPVEMRPVAPTRRFWEAALRVALDDLADLVAPRIVVVCEGNPAGEVPGKHADHDARCYTVIFGEHEPEATFVSGGNSHDVARDRAGLAAALVAVLKNTTVRLLIDRDDHSPADTAEHEARGVRVLRRRNIEAYLYDDEVLRRLCAVREGGSALTEDLVAAKVKALKESVGRGNPPDNLKPAAPAIYVAAKRLLGLTGVGNDSRAFERNVLAPLVVPGMGVFEELRSDIFDVAPTVGDP